MSNPVLSRNNNFNDRGREVTNLETLYNQPAYSQATVMTYENTMQKIALVFGLMLLATPVGWMFPALAMPAAIVAFVLVLVNAFKKQPSVGLTISYAFVEGVFVGGITNIFDTVWPGVAMQAVIATLVTVGVVLALFKSGRVRASAKATKIFLVAMLSYLAFSLVNVGLIIFGATDTPFGINGMNIPGTSIPIGIVVGALAVLLASYSLVLDFDFIKTGVQNRINSKEGWNAALGLLVTVVWLYVEFLRIFALSRD